jgi:hypothetical protein
VEACSTKPFLRLGVGHRQADDLGEVGEDALDVVGQRVGRDRRDGDHAPHMAADGDRRGQGAAVSHARGALGRRVAVDADGAALGDDGVQVVARNDRQHGPRLQRGAGGVGVPRPPDDRRGGPGQLEDPAAVDPQQRGDAPRGEDADVGGRRAGGHRGGEVADRGVLVGQRQQQGPPGDDDGGQRAEDERDAQRAGGDTLYARVRVVEQRQLMGDDGTRDADGRQPARVKARRVDDDEDRDHRHRRVEAVGGVHGQRGAGEADDRPDRQDPGGHPPPVDDGYGQQAVDDAGEREWDEHRAVRDVGAGQHEQQQGEEACCQVQGAPDAAREDRLALPQPWCPAQRARLPDVHAR